MDNELLTRTFIALGLIVSGLGIYQLVTRMILNRAATAPLPSRKLGRPALLYFTTPDCAPCRTVQRPAVLKVKQALGDELEVVEINAQERPDLAKAWGVFSVPTTFILNREGKPLHVNHGVTPADKLLHQMRTALS